MNLKNEIQSFFKELIKYAKIKKKATITIIIIGMIFIGFIIFLAKYRQPENQIGNLKNDGFVNYNKNIIYCQGYVDGEIDGLYKVKGKNKEKISEDKPYYININGNYIFYFDDLNSNIVRLSTNGKDRKVIIENVDKKEILVKDNSIYYFKNTYLYKADLYGENRKRICNNSIENYQITGDTIYYSFREYGKYVIAKTKIEGGSVDRIADDCGMAFYIKDNTIYYIHEENDIENFETVFSICQMKKDGTNKKTIKKIEGILDLETINFVDSYIYYVKGNEAGEKAIYSIKLNGKNEKTISQISNNSTKVIVYNNWVYYLDKNENDNIEIFKIKTNGKNKIKL